MDEKLSWLLECHYNMFHADLIQRAMYDDSVSLLDFVTGCVAIQQNERNSDDDEYVPSEFKNV